MRRLAHELCDDLARQTARQPNRSQSLPIGLFRLLADALNPGEFDHWKVVGWIEGLNDLVYFTDIQRQFVREHDRRGFAEQLLAECQEKLYENSYLDDLFPDRKPDGVRLAPRLAALCARLGAELTQEALFLVPGLPCRWLAQTGQRRWSCDGSLGANFERAELPGTIAVGLDGAFVQAPVALRRAIRQAQGFVRIVVSQADIRVRVGRVESRLCASTDAGVAWDWPLRAAQYIVRPNETWPRGLSLGPQLIYNSQRVPIAVRASDATLAERLRRAVEALAVAWPAGHALLGALTSRIVPLEARGVVSFSYRHRPGISYINLFERKGLDTIDDLVHENSHHHLNLLLRKAVLYKGDHNRELFYSPWRRSLRPLRGILHATFTFTMGALLFERLAQWGRTRGTATAWAEARLTGRDLPRAHFRCLEEIASVQYSLQDLRYADKELGWIPKAGRQLVDDLAQEMLAMTAGTGGFKKTLTGTSFVRELSQHERALRLARETFGLQE